MFYNKHLDVTSELCIILFLDVTSKLRIISIYKSQITLALYQDCIVLSITCFYPDFVGQSISGGKGIHYRSLLLYATTAYDIGFINTLPSLQGYSSDYSSNDSIFNFFYH